MQSARRLSRRSRTRSAIRLPVLPHQPRAALALREFTRQVTVYGCRVELSNLEYRLLEHLMLHAGEVVSKTALSQRLYGEENEPEYNAIDTLIARIRRNVAACRSGAG